MCRFREMVRTARKQVSVTVGAYKQTVTSFLTISGKVEDYRSPATDSRQALGLSIGSVRASIPTLSTLVWAPLG